MKWLSELLFAQFTGSELHPAPLLLIIQRFSEATSHWTPQYCWAPLTVAALTLLFHLRLFFLSCRPAAASIMSQTRDVHQSFCLGLGLSLLPELRLSSQRPARHWFTAPWLPCFRAGLQHPFTFKKASFSTWCFTKPSFIYSLQIYPSGQLERWHRELPPRASSPRHRPTRHGCKWSSTKAPKMKGLQRIHFPWGLSRGHVTDGKYWAWAYGNYPSTAQPFPRILHEIFALRAVSSHRLLPYLPLQAAIACCLSFPASRTR